MFVNDIFRTLRTILVFKGDNEIDEVKGAKALALLLDGNFAKRGETLGVDPDLQQAVDDVTVLTNTNTANIQINVDNITTNTTNISSNTTIINNQGISITNLEDRFAYQPYIAWRSNGNFPLNFGDVAFFPHVGGNVELNSNITVLFASQRFRFDGAGSGTFRIFLSGHLRYVSGVGLGPHDMQIELVRNAAPLYPRFLALPANADSGAQTFSYSWIEVFNATDTVGFRFENFSANHDYDLSSYQVTINRLNF
jgi:hypothetical protein